MKGLIARLWTQRMRRYLVTGFSCFALEAVIVLTLPRLGLSNELTVTVSYWIGLIASFVMQKLYAFSDHHTGKVLAGQGLSYAILVAINYGFTLGVTALVGHSLPLIVTRIGTLAVTTTWNYLIYDRIIFRHRHRTQTDTQTQTQTQPNNDTDAAN